METKKTFHDCIDAVISALTDLSKTKEVLTDSKGCVKVARFMAFIYELEEIHSRSSDFTQIDLFEGLDDDLKTVNQ